MRILVVGGGSTGGYFGGRLSQAGRDVTFLLRPARAESLRKNGLVIRSTHGDVTLQPKIITAGENTAPFDLVLLSVKSWSLPGAMEDFAPLIGQESMILPFLNGMRHMDALRDRFGASAVLGGACRVSATLDADGAVRQLSPIHQLEYGELNGEISSRLQKLHSTMQGSGFDAVLSTSILRAMWEKWAMIATMCGVTCLMRGNVGEIARTPNGKDFLLSVFDEVLGTISQVGTQPSPEFIAAWRKILTQTKSDLAPSLYRDVEAGNRIEKDAIIDDLIERGRLAGVPVPLLTLIATNLAVYEGKSIEGKNQ
jgi:2-dehydropantoate 2-reductase